MGQGVVVVVGGCVGFFVVVVVAGGSVGPHEDAHCLSQHCSPVGQSLSTLQSEQLQSVLVSQSKSGQLFAAQVSSQLWQPTSV